MMNTLILPSTTTTNRMRRYSIFLACCAALHTGSVNSAEVPDPLQLNGIKEGILTPNQLEMGRLINAVCSSRNADQNFLDRCDALANARGTTEGALSNEDLAGILKKVTDGQNFAKNNPKKNTNSTLSNRIAAIRTGRQSGGLQLSGLMFDSNGNPVSLSQLAKLNTSSNKAAAGDNSFDRLGIFVNGNIGFGDRRTTVNEYGYNQDTHGATAGIDYRFTDHFLLGTAFSYNNTRTGYTNSLGSMDTDSFSGALYGSFFTDNGFFVDGIFSGSHLDYSSKRNIQYTLSTDTKVGGLVNTDGTGKNQGTEFNVAMTSGFNFNKGGLTLTPQLRVDYTNTQVGAMDENKTNNLKDGWALHVDQQSFESLQTAAGLQLAYAINLPWGVISPMVRAEYIHEFLNDSRNIHVYALGDKNTAKINANLKTDNPDRDFIVASAGLSAQFAHGISAFVNYDTVQAHSYINNHNFSGGVRVELPF
ncbi:Putative Outer membrane autotransporter barrel domain protein (modular protein) [Crenothrix polyspora]|uniref:Putative Outer membrane autotransporter barrel domain protein (Modular protein) n=1 Tax=Crenothrix polyspora TaxID=360316 RepID=A0A1R4HAM2_9GAMM|nr:autotransporter outer membrane beta-barrel domain-containing protein [Crenothrix polyspora]SJM93312.1 Putative Outer membrane autotransporter barrel domain protein (modular protein) [Crenothrix polyspora]